MGEDFRKLNGREALRLSNTGVDSLKVVRFGKKKCSSDPASFKSRVNVSKLTAPLKGEVRERLTRWVHCVGCGVRWRVSRGYEGGEVVQN